MKYAILVMLVSTLARVTSATAEEYVAIGAGASFWNQTHNSDELEGGSEPGFLLNATLGRTYGTAYRVEVEAQYSRNNVHGINDPDNGFKSTGDGNTLEAAGIFVNAAYDFRFGKTVRPYLIVGPGLLYINVSDDGDAENPLDDDALTTAIQVGLGVRFDVSDNVGIDFGARQMFSSADIAELNADYDTTTFTLAAIIKF